jgi:hypothetical protein
VLWSALLGVLLLGGALGPGFVLSYDMVWVPDLALSADALGLGSALPRAVPSDAVVAVLDEVVPGMLLQKLVLVGSLAAGGSGAAALAGPGTIARMVAATVYVWNPFVVERLAMGHWPVLVGCGVLPWVLRAAATWRTTDVLPRLLPVLMVIGSLSATTGLVTAFAACAAAAERTWPRWSALAALSCAVNLPWVVSGMLHAGDATSSAASGGVFAPSSGEGLLPAPLHFLTLGGVWNVETVPASRTGALAVALTVLLVVLAALGARRGWCRVPAALRRPLVVCWVTGMTTVVVTWALPDLTGWLASTVPGGGLVRDGSRMLALAAPLVSVLAGRGAAALAGLLPDVASHVAVGLGCVLAPVALMPDAAMGLSGRLTAADYPAAYESLLHDMRSLPRGDVVLLPFQSYRAPTWNDGGRPVLAPLGRYLRRDVVVEDRLVVDGRVLSGEDPRAEQVRDALAAPTPEARAEELRRAAVRLVVVEELAGMEVPEVSGTRVWQDAGLVVVDLGDGAQAPAPPAASAAAMALAWSGWLAAPMVGLLRVPGRRRAKCRR